MAVMNRASAHIHHHHCLSVRPGTLGAEFKRLWDSQRPEDSAPSTKFDRRKDLSNPLETRITRHLPQTVPVVTGSLSPSGIGWFQRLIIKFQADIYARVAFEESYSRFLTEDKYICWQLQTYLHVTFHYLSSGPLPVVRGTFNARHSFPLTQEASLPGLVSTTTHLLHRSDPPASLLSYLAQ